MIDLYQLVCYFANVSLVSKVSKALMLLTKTPQ
jgi:hypothetical protein